jgi:hypothetical protein
VKQFDCVAVFLDLKNPYHRLRSSVVYIQVIFALVWSSIKNLTLRELIFKTHQGLGHDHYRHEQINTC